MSRAIPSRRQPAGSIAASEIFTAAEIALALGVSPQAVRKTLGQIPESSQKAARGQLAKAWRVENLPPALLERLESIRQAKYHRSIACLLSAPVERYLRAIPPRDPSGAPIPLAKIATAIAPPPRFASEFPELEDAFATIVNPTDPTPAETSLCWRCIVEALADRIAAGGDKRKIKRALCIQVFRVAPFLAKSHAAFRRNLDRKHHTAGEFGIHALIDARSERSGFRRRPDGWDANILLLARHSLGCGGLVAQAFRDLYRGETRTGEQFSEGFRAHYNYDARRRKTYVPATVMAAVRPILKAAKPYFYRPKNARLVAPAGTIK